MKKYCLDLTVSAVEQVHARYVLIRLTSDERLPEMEPGQFVEVRVDDSPTTFLRRPISIHFVDRQHNELWLLVAAIGDGTRRLAKLQAICSQSRQHLSVSFISHVHAGCDLPCDPSGLL